MKIVNKTKKYLSLVKFSHTIFALPFTLMAFVWGIKHTNVEFNYLILLYVVLCMVTARNAAMAFNRLIDYKFDKLNSRTALREIPAGEITKKSALIFISLNSALFILFASLINPLTMWLSPLALLIILGYSYTKRVTYLCHYVIGIALGVAAIAGYIAVTASIDTFSVFLGIIVMTWVASFDILYALQDEQFDKENSLCSIPAKFGRIKALIISALTHSVTIVFVILLGYIYDLNIIYWAGATLFCLIIIAEHIIVTPRNISKVNLAFATFNSVGSVIYATTSIISFYIGRFAEV